jgi:potassium-transporting ATPase KdpC subunit
MKNHWIIGLKLTFATIVIFGAAYPLIITGIAKVAAPNGGQGEVVLADDKTVGFALIGQKFDDDRYFNSRPSAVDYNAAGTGGSNKGPTNPEYLQQVQTRIDTFLTHNPTVRRSDVPVDLVTASGGGLDPHITPQAASVQVARIAKIRALRPEKVEALVKLHVEDPILGMGPARVHVLKLNMALDQLKE